jgi:alcohol dehydrogenase class IV
MEPFVYQAQPQRVVFGSGTLAAVGEEITRLGRSRALVLSTPQQEATVATLARELGPLCAGFFSGAAMHTPVEVTEKALARVAELRVDCVVALGGGSTTGLAKAIALRTELPQIVIPTTYAGSEATPIIGETQHGKKTTQRTPRVLPAVVIYDVELTMSLPPALSVTSGMNAIAHAVEARYARERNPIISLLAVEGTRALAAALPRIVANPKDRDARSDALFGAWACGTCLGNVGMALHHKICHVLGGTFDLPHAETHTVVLPHAVAYNEPATEALLKPIADVLGARTAAAGLYDLEARLGAPRTLAEIGMPEDGLAKAADEIVASPYWNPRPVEREGVLRLLEDAFAGRRPAS